MPLYDIKCEVCGCEKEIFCCYKALPDFIINETCDSCGGHFKQLLSIGRAGDWFKPHINENFDGTPIEVRSRGHLKELCKKFNVTSRALA